MGIIEDVKREYERQLERGGYATPPGREACAMQRARARVAATRDGASWEWTFDETAASAMGEDASDGYVFLQCLMRDPDGAVVGSIGAVEVTGEEDDYCRVIEAELAQDANYPGRALYPYAVLVALPGCLPDNEPRHVRGLSAARDAFLDEYRYQCEGIGADASLPFAASDIPAAGMALGIPDSAYRVELMPISEDDYSPDEPDDLDEEMIALDERGDE